MNETFLEDYTKLVIENHKLKKQLEQLAETNKNGIAYNMEQDEYITKLEADNKQLLIMNNDLESEVECLERALKYVESEYVDTSRELEEALGTIDDLENELEELS